MFKSMRNAIRRFPNYLHEIDWAAIVGSALLLTFAFAVFVPFATLGEHQYQKTQSQTENGAPDVSVADRAAVEVAEYTQVLAWFTAILAGVSICQLYFLRRSDETARTSAESANIAAKAALHQTNALIAIESPVVILAELTMRQPPNAMLDDDGPLVTKYPTSMARVLVTFKNVGRTAAVAKRLCLKWEITKELPEEPNYEGRFGQTTDLDRSIIQVEGTLEYTRKTIGILPSPDDARLLDQGRASIWVYGFLEFEDFMENGYVLGFARVWEVPGVSRPDVAAAFLTKGRTRYDYYRKKEKPE